MIATYLFLLFGILLLYLGGEALIKGGSSLALRFKLSPLIIGLIIIGYGTSVPELLVTLGSAIKGYSNLSVGNAIGSNIFTIGFILSISSLIRPVTLRKQNLKFDLPVLLLASLLLSLFTLNGKIQLFEAILFFLLFLAYTISAYTFAKKEHLIEKKDIVEEIGTPLKSFYLDLLFILGGIFLLVYGASLLINHAIILSNLYNINHAVVGLTIAAIGTSLPELSCTIVALVRKKNDILIGNILGSNIYNILANLGISAIIVHPLQITQIHKLDLAMMLGTTLILFPFFRSDMRISRMKASILLIAYILYMYSLWHR